MKKLILLSAFFMFSLSNSQQKIEITPSGLSNISQVVELKGSNAPEIYKRLNNFIQKSYVNPEKVAKGNIENEFISLNGVKKFESQGDMKSLNYFVSIDIKDDKMRVTFDKLSEYIPAANLTTEWIGMNGNLYFDKSGNVIKRFAADKDSKEKAVNSILNEIVKSVKEMDKNSDW